VLHTSVAGEPRSVNKSLGYISDKDAISKSGRDIKLDPPTLPIYAV
jgi:hypothetical protein